MKKIIVSVLSLLLVFTLFSCGEKEVKASVIKGFDSAHGDDIDYNSTIDYTLPEYEGVTFRWHSGFMEAIDGNGSTILYAGMPIESVYFSDLTGDGKMEICSTIMFGSGMIDSEIVAYDYENKVLYNLSKRAEYDYKLNATTDSLIVEKYNYMSADILESGILEIKDGVLKMKED